MCWIRDLGQTRDDFTKIRTNFLPVTGFRTSIISKMSRRVPEFFAERGIHGRTGFESRITANALNGKLVFFVSGYDLQRLFDPVIVDPFIEIITHALVDARGDES